MENPVRPLADHTHNHEPSPAAIAGASPQDVAECPVMVGTTVIKRDAEAEGLHREHDGRHYWLCCDTCADLFDGDPDRYAETG